MRIRVGAALTAVILLGLGLHEFVSVPRPRLESPSAIRAIADAAASRLQWRLADSRGYVFDLGTQLSIRQDAESAPSTNAQVLRGLLGMRVIDIEPEEITVVFVIRDSSEATALSFEGSAPFVTTFSRLGAPTSFRFMIDGRPEIHHRAAENLIRAFQLVLSDDTAAASWQVAELDGTGPYCAHYILGADKRSATRSKRDLELATDESGGRLSLFPEPEVQVLRSATTLRWSPEGSWIDAADIDEEVEIRSSLGQSVRARVTGSLGACPWPEQLDGLLPDSLSAFSAAAEARSEQDHEMVVTTRTGPLSAARRESFMGSIQTLLATRGNGHQIIEELAQAIREHPELASEIGRALAHSELSSDLSAGLVHVLELADNQAAENELRALIDDLRGSGDARLQAVVAATGLTRPSDSMVATLWMKATDTAEEARLSNSAILALGAIARSLREHDTGRSAQLSARLVQELGLVSGPEKQALLLAAIANMRDPTVGLQVSSMLTSDSPIVRAAAAHAVQASIPGKAAPILSRALESESSAPVKRALLAGLIELDQVDSEVLRGLARRVADERDAPLRAAMAGVLARHVDRFPEAREALLELIRTDAVPAVRRAAASALRTSR